MQTLIVTAAAFALVFGVVWFASSLGGGVRSEAEVNKPALPNTTADEAHGTPQPTGPSAGLVRVAPSDTSVTAIPPDPRRSKPACAPRVINKPRPVTPKDMFPVGSIAQNTPVFAHPYRKIAELFPSFEYDGGLWMATGRFVTAMQADLTPTGYRLLDGRKLFAVANTSAPNSVLFIQSANNPYKFAVYRRA